MRVTFTGDILIEREQLKAVGENHNFSEMLKPLANVFNHSDYIVGNLETPIAGEDLHYSEKLWSFNTPESLLSALSSAGFSVLTLANNHCLDRGVEGLNRTVAAVRKYGFASVGAYDSPDAPHYALFDCAGRKLAFLSHTYGTNSAFNGVVLPKDEQWRVGLLSPQERPMKVRQKTKIYNCYNIHLRVWRKMCGYYREYRRNKIYWSRLCRDIDSAKKAGADFIIALPHIGGQYSVEPPRYSKRVVNWLLNHGADLVVGNHEHVIERAGWADSKFYAYCLGNFTCYPGSESARKSDIGKLLKRDVSVILHVDFSDVGEYPAVSFAPVKNVIDPDGVARVYPLCDLIVREHNDGVRDELIRENAFAVSRFTNRKQNDIEVKQEYQFSNGE